MEPGESEVAAALRAVEAAVRERYGIMGVGIFRGREAEIREAVVVALRAAARARRSL